MGDAEGPVVEDDIAEVDDGAPVLADDARDPRDESVRYSLAWWLSFAIPISIALVAIMGAVVGYRAEYHASLSSADDNDAQIASTYLSGHTYNALLTGQSTEADHDLWEQLTKAGPTGDGPAMVTAAEPSCAEANVDARAASVPAAESIVDCRLAQVFSSFAMPAYWLSGNAAAFDRQRFVADWIALGNIGRDVAVGRHTAAANDQRHRELLLLWLAIALALALAFCTLAQAAMHHRWTRRTLRTALLLAVPGWVLLVGCTTLLLAWEI